MDSLLTTTYRRHTTPISIYLQCLHGSTLIAPTTWPSTTWRQPQNLHKTFVPSSASDTNSAPRLGSQRAVWQTPSSVFIMITTAKFSMLGKNLLPRMHTILKCMLIQTGLCTTCKYQPLPYVDTITSGRTLPAYSGSSELPPTYCATNTPHFATSKPKMNS